MNRDGKDGSAVRPDDQCKIKVTNLSEETQDVDLRELFSHFGTIRRAVIIKDRVTQKSKVC